jgi:hypothetical protein
MSSAWNAVATVAGNKNNQNRQPDKSLLLPKLAYGMLNAVPRVGLQKITPGNLVD